MHIGGLFVVLQLLAAAHALEQAGAAGPACSVATPAAFLACLEDPRATDILVQKDVNVGDVLSKYAGAGAAPLQLDRYVTTARQRHGLQLRCLLLPPPALRGHQPSPVFPVSHRHAGTSQYRGPSTRSLTIGRCWISGWWTARCSCAAPAW